MIDKKSEETKTYVDFDSEALKETLKPILGEATGFSIIERELSVSIAY